MTINEKRNKIVTTLICSNNNYLFVINKTRLPLTNYNEQNDIITCRYTK